MKILAIGDLHGKLPEIPRDIDVILLNGDLGKSDLARKFAFKHMGNPAYSLTSKQEKRAYLESYNSTIDVLSRLGKIAPTYFIYGNVEATDKEIKDLSKKIRLKLPLLGKNIKKLKNVYSLNEKIKSLKGISVAGCPYFIEKEWAMRFRNFDYDKRHKKEDEDARRFFGKLGKVDILLVHQPPYGVLDKVSAKFAPKQWQGKHAGSHLILSYIKRKHPRFVICGHIHEARGEVRIGKTKIINLGMQQYKIIKL